MSVPKLRFKEFAGEWLEKNLGDFVGFTSGHPFDGSKFGMDGKKLVIPKNFTKFGHGNFSTEYSKFTTEESNPKYICRSGDLLLLMTDLSRECELLGKPLYLKNDDKEVLLNQRIVRVEPSGVIHLPFLLNLLLTDRYHKKIKELATGSTVKHLSITSIREIRLNYPGYDEQEKLATFLSKVDQKISLLTKKHDLLIQYKKGVMRKIFNLEIRFNDRDGGDFPEWKTLPLCEVAQIIGGGTPETSVQANWGGDVQWFTPTELKQKYVSKSVRTITTDGLANSSAKLLPAGAVLFSSRATVGDTAISLNECCTNQGFQSFVMKSGYNNEFLYYWIANNKKLFLEKASGSTFLEISKREIEKLLIQAPCIDEQKRVADFLVSIDQAIELNQYKLDLIKQYKQGLLQQMFI